MWSFAQCTLRNDGEAREVELMDYMEVILAGERDDQAHPAFSGLFVQTDFHERRTNTDRVAQAET